MLSDDLKNEKSYLFLSKYSYIYCVFVWDIVCARLPAFLPSVRLSVRPSFLPCQSRSVLGKNDLTPSSCLTSPYLLSG